MRREAGDTPGYDLSLNSTPRKEWQMNLSAQGYDGKNISIQFPLACCTNSKEIFHVITLKWQVRRAPLACVKSR